LIWIQRPVQRASAAWSAAPGPEGLLAMDDAAWARLFSRAGSEAIAYAKDTVVRAALALWGWGETRQRHPMRQHPSWNGPGAGVGRARVQRCDGLVVLA
jgi:hypothetical protein